MRRALFATSILMVARCATLGPAAHGDENLPATGVGPFRKLTGGEVRGAPPYLLDDQAISYREASAIALGPVQNGIASTSEVALYLVVKNAGGHDVLARTRALDGRTFFGATQDLGHKVLPVLAADATWEGADLAGPSALRVGSEIWLYYASNGAIGLAKSPDGLAFTKVAAPVLTPDASFALMAPSVAILSDGRFRMLFVQGDSIYEAGSADGVTWQRLDADPSTPAMDPILAPAAPKTNLGVGELPPFDTLRVDDPCLLPRMTVAGRLQIRVLYTGYAQGDAAAPDSAIGFAARYGDSGPLVRSPGAVYAVGKHEHAPAVFEWDLASPISSDEGGAASGGALLYVTQDASQGGYPTIAGAFAPPTETLPLPDSYPPSP